ncbi:MAG: helix-turn-helix domain-containing protein [Actinobacteria bacterium]|nr:helix-turn-helix domain-containing protein [Actinomycetota bacterium]
MDESGIGKRLRNIRRSRMWNQHKLAEEAGVSPTTVSGIETGRISTPHFGTLHKLAQALDVNPQVLFSRRLEEASLEGIEALSGQLKEERERLQRLYGEFPRGSEQRRFIKQQLRDVSAQSESVTTSMMFHPGKGTEGYKDDHEEA